MLISGGVEGGGEEEGHGMLDRVFVPDKTRMGQAHSEYGWAGAEISGVAASPRCRRSVCVCGSSVCTNAEFVPGNHERAFSVVIFCALVTRSHANC
jgi:hypothetical protein